MNGWYYNDFRQVNYVDGIWFGLLVDKWDSGNLESIVLRINDKRFGWYESYNMDGYVDPHLTGYFLNNEKI